MEFTKISDTEIEVTKTAPVQTVKTKYERKFIREQIRAIKASRDEFVAQRNVEIDECQEILAEMDRAGVVEVE